jgi:TetR/AcrR family transcriptional regulator
MYKMGSEISRRQEILLALSKMLENSPGERITTAALAKLVGVSEAALYRHFPSKTKMFEGLIDYIEESVFSQITLILTEEKSPLLRCEFIIRCLLLFVEKNPGLSRLLLGDVLTGETARLRQRIAQFYERVETQLKTTLRELELPVSPKNPMSASIIARFLITYADGCISHFVRSEFHYLPTAHWNEQWQLLSLALTPMETELQSA